jgi:hypothetical protein
MKRIRLKQYIEAVRTVELEVPDDCTEVEAAKMLDDMPICLTNPYGMPNNVFVVSNWDYVSDRGIENMDGEVILHEEEEDIDHG